MDTEKQKITTKESLIIIVVAIIIIIFARSCTSKYKKEVSWADTRPLILAVEVDDYEGDILKEGKYNVYVDAVIDGKTAGMYDIYIEDHDIFNKNDLSKPVGTVGGIKNDCGSVTLHKGDYVVIWPIDVFYKPSGYLKMEWIKPL